MRNWSKHCVTLSAFLVGLAAVAACAPVASPPAPTATATRPAATPAGPVPAPVATATQPGAKPSPVAEKPLQPPVKVKYGHLAGSTANSGVYIALERGYFKEQGLDVELETFKSAPDLFPAIGSGQVLSGSSAPNAGLYNAILRGIQVRIVADMGSTRPGERHHALVARKDLFDQGIFKDYPDLKGKSVGVTGVGGGGTYEITINLALKKGNLTTADVNLQNLAFPDLLPALVGKSIDAAILNEPFLTQGIEQGIAVPWKWVADILPPNHQDAVIMFSERFGKDNPEAARRWMVAYLKGVRDYNDAFNKGKDKAQITAIIAKYLGMKDASILERVGVYPLNPNGHVNPATLVEDVDWNLQKGYIKEKVDIASLVDRQWVEYALEKLGSYK